MKYQTCLFLLKYGLLFKLISTCCCYRYPLYESLEWTHSRFVKERKLFEWNSENRNTLLDLKKSLVFFKDWNFNFLNVSNVAKVAIQKELYRNYLHAYDYKKNVMANKIEEKTKNAYTSQETMISASIAVIKLYETYGTNITEYSKGHLDLKSDKDKNTRVVDSLQIDDLAFMSYISIFHLMWYDTGLKYLKVAIDELHSNMSERKYDCCKRVNEILLEMRRKYPSLHNNILNEMKYPIGPSWKCFPFMINQGRYIWHFDVTCSYYSIELMRIFACI